MLLEGKRARTALAASEVKQRTPALDSPAHDFPIHEIIGRGIARAIGATRIIRQHLVAEIKAQDTADRRIAVQNGEDLAVLAEFALQGGDVSTRENRRAQTMHAAGIDRIEAIDGPLDFAAQAVLDALAHHRALFARDRLHICVVVGRNLLAERRVSFGIPDPVVVVRRHQLVGQHIDPKLLRQRYRRAVERGIGLVVDRCGSAINAKRIRYQRVAKQPAAYMDERQDSAYRTAALGEQEIAVMSETLRQHPPPSCTVKECRLRTRRHESVPARAFGIVERPDTQRG